MPNGPCQLRIDFDGLPILDMFGFVPNGMRSRATHDRARQVKTIVEQDLARTRDPVACTNHVVALNRRAKYAWMLRYLESVLADPVDPASESQTEPAAR
jgi:hypothetical protein